MQQYLRRLIYELWPKYVQDMNSNINYKKEKLNKLKRLMAKDFLDLLTRTKGKAKFKEYLWMFQREPDF